MFLEILCNRLSVNLFSDMFGGIQEPQVTELFTYVL